jgi:HEPN domain-containing protein
MQPDELAHPYDAQRRESDRWQAQADADLRDAEMAAQAGSHALACFLSQQTAEKAVSGYLFARGAERVWGHALADLCEDAKALDPSFDVIKTVAMLLDKHYLTSRYPSALPGGIPALAYDAEDSRRAIEIAHDVRDFVSERLRDAPPDSASVSESR